MKQILHNKWILIVDSDGFPLNNEYNFGGEHFQNIRNVENLTNRYGFNQDPTDQSRSEKLFVEEREKRVQVAIRAAVPSARNHFHRSSFAGKDYGESIKGDVDLDVTSRLNYLGVGKCLELISTAIRSADSHFPLPDKTDIEEHTTNNVTLSKRKESRQNTTFVKLQMRKMIREFY